MCLALQKTYEIYIFIIAFAVQLLEYDSSEGYIEVYFCRNLLFFFGSSKLEWGYFGWNMLDCDIFKGTISPTLRTQ